MRFLGPRLQHPEPDRADRRHRDRRGHRPQRRLRRAAAAVRLAQRLPAQRRPRVKHSRSADVGRGAGPAAGRAARGRRRSSAPSAASAAPASSTAPCTSARARRGGQVVDRRRRSSTRCGRCCQPRDRADLDGQLHQRRVRRDRRRRRRRRPDGGDHRLARHRTLHRAADPQVLRRTTRRPASDTAEIHLVSSFMASLLIGGQRADRLRRRRRHEPARARDRQLEPDAARRDRARARQQAQAAVAERRRRSASSPTTSSSRYGFTAGDAVSRVFGRQPVQPGRHGRDPPRHRGHQPGDQRHDVRRDGARRAPTRAATATCSATRPAASWRCAASRTGRSRARRSPSGCSLGWDDFARAILERDQAGQRRQPPAALLRPGDHAAPARAGAALVRHATTSSPARTPAAAAARWSRRRRCRCACTPTGSASAPERILVTGGASKNPGILRVLADVFQAEIVPLRVVELIGPGRRPARCAGGRGARLGRPVRPFRRPRPWIAASRPTPARRGSTRTWARSSKDGIERPAGRNQRIRR